MPHLSGTMTELVREVGDGGLSQEPVPGAVEIAALTAFGNCKALLEFISHHCGLYISTCMPTDGEKIIFPYNLGGKEEIDHYCFPSLNTLEVIRVLMKASVWC